MVLFKELMTTTSVPASHIACPLVCVFRKTRTPQQPIPARAHRDVRRCSGAADVEGLEDDLDIAPDKPVFEIFEIGLEPVVQIARS